MSALRLYSPSLVLAVMAGVRLAGLTSHFVAGIFFAVLAMAFVISEQERRRRWKEEHSG